MKLHKILLLMVAAVMSLSLSAHTLRSPQDVLQLEVGVNQNGTPVYELRRGEKTVLRPSTLGIEIKGAFQTVFVDAFKKTGLSVIPTV